MLEIYPIQTKDEQISICNMIGASFIEDTRAYIAALDDEPIAICQFKLADDVGEIRSLDSLPSADFRSLLSLASATLSFIELCGCKRASFLPNNQDDKLITAIGFTNDENGILSVDLK